MNRFLTGVELAEAAALYADGWPLRDLGSRFGCSPGFIRKCLAGAGVVIRPRGARPAADRTEGDSNA